ncbi:hypothetical protein RND81_02G227500 [Saponaria officinalis]|uniref:WAT1-related protein n=1 Tax=Saponaria officinalis TaxID=3572 RepID=A0AAW1MPK6_SAPOF
MLSTIGVMITRFLRGMVIKQGGQFYGRRTQFPNKMVRELLTISKSISSACFNIIEVVVQSGILKVFISWCILQKGPLFVSSFTPLSLITMIFLGTYIWDEELYIGSILGAMTIILGLYIILRWDLKDLTTDEGDVP